jgi:transposase
MIIKNLEAKVVGLLKETKINQNKIANRFGLSRQTIRNIQNKAIEQGILDKRYRRFNGGIIQYQKDDVIKLLGETKFSLRKIAEKVGLSQATTGKIQNKSIEQGILDEKYRRLGKGIKQYQKDEVIKLLGETVLSQTEIGRNVGLNAKTINNIQNEAIEKGILDKRYRRLDGGVIRYQKDGVIKLLGETKLNHSEIGNKFGLSHGTISNIQYRAIKEGILDKRYRRLYGGMIQYQQDEAIKLIRETNFSQNEIANKLELSPGTITHIQNKAMKEGILDEKYRRLAGGLIQYQKDEVIKLLGETVLSLRKIGDKIGLSQGIIRTIQNRAMKEGILDDRYRRTNYKNLLEQAVDLYIEAGK